MNLRRAFRETFALAPLERDLRANGKQSQRFLRPHGVPQRGRVARCRQPLERQRQDVHRLPHLLEVPQFLARQA
ncbi:MAG TPA: hypothetical protein VMO24_10175 [Woeseiaceae bacterium]|nr:hypothetical protein [Woeseiaceae bacterium]